MKCYKRLIYKQFVQVSGLCAPQFLSYLLKHFTHLCIALYREFNVHICPQIHLRGTRESDPIFETPAEISVKAPLSALRSPRDTRRDTKLTLSPTKKNHAICFRSHKSLHYHPQGIFLKKRVCDTFYTLCDIRFCQSINKRTKENVNHCNNQSQLKIHGYF